SHIAHSAHLGGMLFVWFAFANLNQTNLSVQERSGGDDPASAHRPGTRRRAL
ncbi:hypothetical protein EMGBS10_01590, partial [Opitutia bacterium]